MRRIYLAAINAMLLFFLLNHAVAQDSGNTTAQEYGDAVFVYLDVLWGIFNYGSVA